MNEAARELSRLRWEKATWVRGVCETCGTVVERATPRFRFCKPVCRARADYAINGEARRAARRERYRRQAARGAAGGSDVHKARP